VLSLVVIYAPIALMVLFAFNASERVGLPFEGWSLKWFGVAATDSLLGDALSTSVTVMAWAVGLSLVLGTAAGLHLARSRGRWRALAIGVLALPLCLPPVTRGLWTVIVGHSLLITPIVVFIVMVRLEGLDPGLERVAMDLGARPWQAFLYVTLPQVFPAICAAAFIGAAISLDEFIMTFLVTGQSVTLPLFIYSGLRYQQTPELNALSTLMLATCLLLCALGVSAARIGARRVR
jgi:spermidine/putrescine transport system permease protein